MDSGPEEQIPFNDDTALIYATQHGYYQLALDLSEARRRINLNIINLKRAHETSQKKEAESDLSVPVNMIFSNAGTALTQSTRANNHAEKPEFKRLKHWIASRSSQRRPFVPNSLS
jgi:predicted rRNA methylase YqxC with S4 and FtsJ domains